jgi:hypothetical protein
MSKITSNLKAEITRQSDVTSKDIRDNFTNYQNAINDNQDQITALSTSASNNETVQSRPNHSALKERLDSVWVGKQNYVKYGGTVSEQGTPDMTVSVAAGEAKINGVDCKWAVQSSGTVTAPGSNTRLDIVVANSDNTLSIVTGTAAASPVFPTVATTQVVLAALIVKNTTTSLNEGTEIIPMRHQNGVRSYYIGSGTTLTRGTYNYSNLIIDAAVTIDLTSTATSYALFSRELLLFDLIGNFYITTNGSIALASSHDITQNCNGGSNATAGTGGTGGAAGLITDSTITSLGSGKGGQRGNSTDGGGGGGGASLVAAGGAGGNGTAVADSPSGTPSDKLAPFIFVRCYDFMAHGNITLTAGGSDGNAGCGGNGGGALCIVADNDITIQSGVTVSVNGGDGRVGVPSNGGGGGGGGGGLFLARSKTFTNSGTVTVAGGAGGAGDGTGANGTAGTNGVEDQELHTNTAAAISSCPIPFNSLGLYRYQREYI